MTVDSLHLGAGLFSGFKILWADRSYYWDSIYLSQLKGLNYPHELSPYRRARLEKGGGLCYIWCQNKKLALILQVHGYILAWLICGGRAGILLS